MQISLSTLLLFTLLVPFVMSYRISPGDTPFWLFGLIFLGLFLYIVLDLYSKKIKQHFQFKLILLWILIAMSIGAAFYSVIVVRHKVAPVYTVHDIILQQEAAIRFLLDGKNPYATTYFGTPLESFHYSDTETNPALYYFVMEPLYLLSVVPFYVGMVHTIGYFDARLPLYVLFLISLVIISKVVVDKDQKLLAITLFAFNPAQLSYVLEGRSDMFVFGFFIVSMYFLQTRKILAGSIFLAFAFCIKQSVWPILPLYILYLFLTTKRKEAVIKGIIPFIAVVVVIVAPFLVWDGKAFIDSTVGYLSGTVPHSYPISGYGFGMVLKSLNFIPDVNAYFPFILLQVIVCMPLFYFLSKLLKKNTSIKVLILTYALLLFVFWYFSRYFNNSHIGYISTLLIIAYFWPKETAKI